MVTSRDECKYVNDAFNAGCDDYITKPIQKDELLGKVRKLLKFLELKKLVDS
jgi:DNA-binding response OmpR family regulator